MKRKLSRQACLLRQGKKKREEEEEGQLDCSSHASCQLLVLRAREIWPLIVRLEAMSSLWMVKEVSKSFKTAEKQERKEEKEVSSTLSRSLLLHPLSAFHSTSRLTFSKDGE